MHGDADAVQRLAGEVESVARDLELSRGSYELLRVGTNVVWANTGDRVLARVAPPWQDQPAAQQMLDVALTAIAAGAPFTAPLSHEALILPSGAAVTFWTLGDVVDPSPHQMALLAAELHALDAPTGVPAWSFMDRRVSFILRTLNIAMEVGAPSWMTSELAERYKQAVERLGKLDLVHRPIVLLHGDLYPANVVAINGVLRCCDLDDVCNGPCEVDLCATGIHARRIWGGNSWAEFIAVYPYPYDLELVEALIAEKNVSYTIWLASLWASRPESRPALMRQVATLDDPTALWEDM